MMGTLTPADAARWEDIRKTFRRNQYTRGADGADPVGRLVSQLSLFQAGLESIQTTLAEAANRLGRNLDNPATASDRDRLRATGLAEDQGKRIVDGAARFRAAFILQRLNCGLVEVPIHGRN